MIEEPSHVSCLALEMVFELLKQTGVADGNSGEQCVTRTPVDPPPWEAPPALGGFGRLLGWAESSMGHLVPLSRVARVVSEAVLSVTISTMYANIEVCICNTNPLFVFILEEVARFG